MFNAMEGGGGGSAGGGEAGGGGGGRGGGGCVTTSEVWSGHSLPAGGVGGGLWNSSSGGMAVAAGPGGGALRVLSDGAAGPSVPPTRSWGGNPFDEKPFWPPSASQQQTPQQLQQPQQPNWHPEASQPHQRPSWSPAEQQQDMYYPAPTAPPLPHADDMCCVICLTGPRDVGLLHGETVHKCVCKECSGLLGVGKPCPLCRQLVERILRLYD